MDIGRVATVLVIISAAVILLSLVLSSVCQPYWSASVVSGREKISADSACHGWCADVYGVSTSRISFRETDEYGFSTYDCYCDLSDCGNPFSILRNAIAFLR